MSTNPVKFYDSSIQMAHGAGGKASRRLVEGLIAPLFGLAEISGEMSGQAMTLNDAAYLPLGSAGTLAFTTDSFVVKPLRFAGGSIGDLAVNGTINDLAVSGAKPLALVSSFILEAGLSSEVLEIEVRTMAEAAKRAGVRIVGGDTKVVEHGSADGMFITTAGIGLVDTRAHLGAQNVRVGDKVIVSGPLGDHGITVLLARGDVDLETDDLRSDTRPLWHLVNALLTALEGSTEALRWMRDPTRGGAASALNELANDCGLCVALQDEKIPVRESVRGACELLGLDPLTIACEGQFIAIVAPEYAERACEVLGKEAVVMGEITQTPAKTVISKTQYGGTRVIDMLTGDPLPRIC